MFHASIIAVRATVLPRLRPLRLLMLTHALVTLDQPGNALGVGWVRVGWQFKHHWSTAPRA
jgi:hypothetical protein